MADFVWCKNEECRIPNFRCLLCREACYPVRHGPDGEGRALELLLKTGKYKERYVMKRKENLIPQERPSLEAVERKNEPREESQRAAKNAVPEQRVFLLEDGKLKPFTREDYTASTLYQVVESYVVECRLVRPEDPGNLIFEGKKPSRKTVPIVVTKDGTHRLLESWESLESQPEQLSDAAEVIGAAPVKQVFVLRRT